MQFGLAGFAFAALLGPTPAAARSLSTFLDVSRAMTGFAGLEGWLGQRYLDSLLAWDDHLPSLLDRWASGVRSGWSKTELASLDGIIECWYTGMVPTAGGTVVVTYEHALGQACLPRRTPVTFCR